MDFELFQKVANVTEQPLNELSNLLCHEDSDSAKILALSFIGLMVDSICDRFELDENETWEQLYETHKFVNATEGDFHAN